MVYCTWLLISGLLRQYLHVKVDKIHAMSQRVHIFIHIYVTVFWKTEHLRTRTEIYLLPVHDRHSCTIQKYQVLDNKLLGVLLQKSFN